MKYFCENAPQYHIACAGYLLGIALSKPSSFPVGKVNFMQIDPMTFTETDRLIGLVLESENAKSKSEKNGPFHSTCKS